MDRGPADVSFTGVLREAHHLVFISKTENLDMHKDELIKKNIFINAFSRFKILRLEWIV